MRRPYQKSPVEVDETLYLKQKTKQEKWISISVNEYVIDFFFSFLL